MPEYKNPVTGDFEEMTSRQWWLLKVGLKKDTTISDENLAVLKGPECAVEYATKIYFIYKPATHEWLLKRYNEYFPRPPKSGKELVEWGRFILDVYNIARLSPIFEEARKLKISLLKTTIDSMKLEKQYNKKVDTVYAKHAKRAIQRTRHR